MMSIQANRTLLPGLSGIMRAKNEEKFIGICIDCIIDSLDELIVVYNDCTDDTEVILQSKVRQYGNKLKIYPYNYNVLFNKLTPEEYEYAVSLPENSPRLFCTQCNYALEHVSYQYVVKIDPDQLYFADEVKKWREVCRGHNTSVNLLQISIAHLFKSWFSLYRLTSAKFGRVCSWMMPHWFVKLCSPSYIAYGRHLLYKGKASIAWSGINVYVEDNTIFIPYDFRNVHPPYNGEGDLVLFKISPETRFTKYLVAGDQTKVLEYMNNPYPMIFAGPMWFHLHANRDYCAKKVSKMKQENPDLFVDADKFTYFSYKDSMKHMRNGIPTLFQQTLFLLVHKIGMPAVRRNLKLLRPYILKAVSKN